MAILAQHVPWYEEIFAQPGVLQDPIAMLGFQMIGINSLCFPLSDPSLIERLAARFRRRSLGLPEVANEEFRAPDLVELLRKRGLRRIVVIDPHDPRSDLKHDMNEPLPPTSWESCQTFIDIGSLEHVFDTRTCLENSLRMIRVGGHFVLHTCVNGYLGHGLHTFNYEGLIDALELNGFRITCSRLMTPEGTSVARPSDAPHTLALILARKERPLDHFRCPQQRGWQEAYESFDSPATGNERLERMKGWIAWFVPPAVFDVYRFVRGSGPRKALVAKGIGSYER